MSAPKYTPGPWRIGDAGFSVFGPKRNALATDTVATVRNRANAALIAAAPDLLEALNELCGELIMNYGQANGPDSITEEVLQKLLRKAGKAIAKAEGRS